MKRAFSILIAVLFVSCSDQGVVEHRISDPDFKVPVNKSAEEARGLIIGDWDWYKSISWSRPDKYTSTPQTEGYTRQMEFLADGRVKIYRNEILERTLTYSIDSLSAIGFLQLEFLSYGTHYDFRVSADYFSYSNIAVDGPAEYFVRRK